MRVYFVLDAKLIIKNKELKSFEIYYFLMNFIKN